MKLHERFSTGAPHTPPCFAADFFVRVRNCVPVPHDLSHLLQPLHWFKTQWTGQAPRLQGVVLLQVFPAASAEQGLPPLDAGVVMERVCVFTPAPHETEHALRPLQVVSQSTGHEKELQLRSWLMCPHALPEFPGAVWTLRKRRWTPVPHERLHWPQLPQLASLQSTGHACVLQGRLSSVAPQAAPPL